jgi:chitinase
MLLTSLFPRTMVWAIDLDDGTLIDELGSNLSREKDKVLSDPPDYLPCFGSKFEDDREL